jgi:hypothetical protein
MKKRGMLSLIRRMRIVGVLLALLLTYGTVSYTLRAANPIQVYAINLGGVTGATNNTVLAYGRYLLIAPFWPSSGVAENGDLDLSQLDNKYLYVIDTKKPSNEPLKLNLTSDVSQKGTVKTIYFPTKVLFDAASSTVYVRGTRFEESEGVVTAIDVIGYVHMNLDDKGKPLFDTSIVPIDIRGVSGGYASDAPQDFALSTNGNLMVFTNGASIFSYDLNQGYLNELPIVPTKEYDAEDTISFLDVDQATNVVSVGWNKKVADAEGTTSLSSDLSFYQLEKGGTFTPMKHVSAGQFPKQTALSRGSNITIVSDPDSDSEFALFTRSDGSLCCVDLKSDGAEGGVKQLYTFSDLAQSNTADGSRLLVQYDSSTRTIGVVKPGFTIQISRPTNGRKGRISRPTNIQTLGAPVLAMAKLSKKGKVGSVNLFTHQFEGEGGLSNFVSWQGSQWLISTYSGKLFSAGIPSDLQNSALQFMGPIGARVERIDYYGDRESIVAIESCTLEDDGLQLASPGSIVVGKVFDLQSQPNSPVTQALLPTVSVLGKHVPAIRRPCNIRR